MVSVYLLACLSACSTFKQSSADLIYAEGCILYVSGLTVEQADEMRKQWNFGEECEVQVITKSD